MKKILFAVLVLSIISAQAQKTVDEIVEKYIATAGGLDAFNKINSAKMTGTVVVQGRDLPISMAVLNGKGMRQDVDAMGQLITICYYNGKGWQVNPFRGMLTPTEVTGIELTRYKAQASLANNLIDYKNRGHQVVLEGEDSIGSVKCLKIKLSNKDDGKVTTYFINAASYVLVMTKSKGSVQGQETDVEMWYSVYKTFGGASIPTVWTQKAGGQVTQEISWSDIEINAKIDETIFNM
jgi:hypothetical protein